MKGAPPFKSVESLEGPAPAGGSYTTAPPSDRGLFGPKGSVLVTEAAKEVVSGSLAHDAPLQLRKKHKAPYADFIPFSTRVLNFVKRNKWPLMFGTFVYVEFVGFGITTVSPQNRVITLRRRVDGKVVKALEYKPPATEVDLQRVGSFSIVDKKLPTMKDLPVTEDRPPFSTRLYNYFSSYFPNPYFSPPDSSASGRNSLQYNRLLYYVHPFADRQAYFLPVDATTKDGRLEVHIALKVLFRPNVVEVPADNPGHPLVGLVEPMFDKVTQREVADWVKNAQYADIMAVPTRRLKSDVTKSLAGFTAGELKAALAASTEAHRRYFQERSAFDAMHGGGGGDESGSGGAPAPVLGPDALDAAETLRRMWTARILEHTRNEIVLEDVLWKMTTREVDVDHDPRADDPLHSTAWQF